MIADVLNVLAIVLAGVSMCIGGVAVLIVRVIL